MLGRNFGSNLKELLRHFVGNFMKLSGKSGSNFGHFAKTIRSDFKKTVRKLRETFGIIPENLYVSI